MSGTYRVVSGAVFGVVAVLQAARAVMQLPVHVGSIEIPRPHLGWLLLSQVVSAYGPSGHGVESGAAQPGASADARALRGFPRFARRRRAPALLIGGRIGALSPKRGQRDLVDNRTSRGGLNVPTNR
jgi:hypothetical protein